MGELPMDGIPLGGLQKKTGPRCGVALFHEISYCFVAVYSPDGSFCFNPVTIPFSRTKMMLTSANCSILKMSLLTGTSFKRGVPGTTMKISLPVTYTLNVAPPIRY